MRGWRVLSGSVPGVAHLRQGGDCEDAFATRQGDDGTLFAAVADGASSGDFSAVGAHLAAYLAVRIAAERWNRPMDADGWRAYLTYVRDQVIERFTIVSKAAAGQLADGDTGDLTRHFSTTLTLAVARPPWVGVLSIGDGFVVVRERASHYHLLRPPETRGTWAGETSFVNSYDPHDVIRIANIPDLSGIAVGTDGMGDICLSYAGADPRKPIAGFFSPVFAWAEDPDVDDNKLVRLFASPDVCARTEDDKSLVAAVLR